jgi:nitrogen fixation negative regulator NifL
VVRRALREARERADRRQAEQQVNIRTLALEASANGILITDRDGKILWANKAFSNMTGYTLAEALNQTPNILHSGEHQNRFYQELWNTILSGTVWRGRITNRKKDGSLYFEEMTITPVRAEREEITHFIAVKQDVTDRHRAEEALKSAQEKLNRMLTHSPAIIYSLRLLEDDIFCPTWVSDNIKQLLGYEPAESTVPGWWFERLHQADRSIAVGNHEQLMSTGHSLKEYRFQHRDGSYRWISDEQRLIRDADGKPLEVVGVWADVTEKKNLEAQLLQAQKLESIGQLAGGVAHDFNNILTVIQGHASLLMLNKALSEPAADSVQQIALASERAAALTRQLLTFSRKQVIQPRVQDLNDVVTNVIKMLKRILREDVSLRVNYSSHLPPIHADTGMLEQIMMNLAVNSRDAMPHGGELVISTSEEIIGSDYVKSHPQATPGEYVCLSVKDSGCGIAPDVLPRIFEPFFTTKAVGQGTGLGLATVYGIVQQHRGWITVDSEVNKGTTFRVYLPASKHTEGNVPEVQREQPVRGGNETVLLVEDEDAVRSLARNVLERKGYRVIEARSAVEALNIWHDLKSKADLILTDMVMPGGMTGLDLIKRIHKDQPGVAAIYTSGYSVEIIGKEFELRDGINFLQKPYGPRRLTQAVRSALDNRLEETRV